MLLTADANAFAEFSSALSVGCFDRMLIFLVHAIWNTSLADCVVHHNQHRPHRSLGQMAPMSMSPGLGDDVSSCKTAAKNRHARAISSMSTNPGVRPSDDILGTHMVEPQSA